MTALKEDGWTGDVVGIHLVAVLLRKVEIFEVLGGGMQEAVD